MAYSNTIPAPTDKISKSQTDLLNNMIALSTLVNVNHENFDTANQGKHKWVSLPEQSAAPAAVGDEMQLYTKEISSVTQLFCRREDGTELNLTGGTLAAKGSTRLPCGLIINWGPVTSEAGSFLGRVNDTFHTAFSSELYFINVQPALTGGLLSANALYAYVYFYNTNQFSAKIVNHSGTGQAAKTALYVAIGY